MTTIVYRPGLQGEGVVLCPGGGASTTRGTPVDHLGHRARVAQTAHVTADIRALSLDSEADDLVPRCGAARTPTAVLLRAE
jgi:predicted alpha/beta-hydrolase family hydrolase